MNEIIQVDPFDPEQFDAWHATYVAADVAGRAELATPWQLEESRAEKQADPPHTWRAVYSLIVDGTVVTAGELWMPLLENLDVAQLEIFTHPEHRRRGYGGRMLAHLEALARRRGRTKLLTETSYPSSADEDGAGEPGPEFLAKHGFTFALGDVVRVVEMPLDPELLDRLAAQAAPHHAEYRLRSFAGPVPEDLVQGFSEVTAALITDAPLGALELEPDIPNVESLRSGEDTLAKMRRTKYNTVALAPDGELVAYTELVMSEEDPGGVFQWGTLVRRHHRGHRLGLAVKVANLQFLQSQRSDARRLTTQNAEQNEHMVAVNELLGFRAVERSGEFQKRLG